MTDLQIQISYATLAVFDPELRDPFNDWTQAQAAQGFAWRDGSVSFRTLIESGPLNVLVTVNGTRTAIRSDSVRAIQVPFRVPSSGIVEIGSISGGTTLKIPSGPYALICEIGSTSDGAPFGRLQFVPDKSAGAAVLRADPELSPPTPLVMGATPA